MTAHCGRSSIGCGCGCGCSLRDARVRAFSVAVAGPAFSGPPSRASGCGAPSLPRRHQPSWRGSGVREWGPAREPEASARPQWGVRAGAPRASVVVRWWRPRAQAPFAVRWSVASLVGGEEEAVDHHGVRPRAWAGERGRRQRATAADAARRPAQPEHATRPNPTRRTWSAGLPDSCQGRPAYGGPHRRGRLTSPRFPSAA